MQYKPFQIARMFGIPLMVDYSWLPMVALHIWLVAQLWLPMKIESDLPAWITWGLGTAITALFFISVVGHELAHAIVARLEGIRIHDIQLHIFGGWARLVGEPRTAMAEFRVAVAGPIASFLLAFLFWMGLYTAQEFAEKTLLAQAAEAAFLYLALANLLLAAFNLLPGLPLDGGRALRAYLWHRSGDILSATRTMARMGVGIAYLLVSYGLFLIGYGMFHGTLWQDFLVAVWLLVVGLFLKTAAESDYRNRLQQSELLHQRTQLDQLKTPGTVGSVMHAPAISVTPDLLISDFIDRVLPNHRLNNFAVAHDGRLHGILSLERLRNLPREKWNHTNIRDVMEPVTDDLFVTCRASIEHAQRKLRENDIGFLAVIDPDGFLIGYLNSSDVEQAV